MKSVLEKTEANGKFNVLESILCIWRKLVLEICSLLTKWSERLHYHKLLQTYCTFTNNLLRENFMVLPIAPLGCVKSTILDASLSWIIYWVMISLGLSSMSVCLHFRSTYVGNSVIETPTFTDFIGITH